MFSLLLYVARNGAFALTIVATTSCLSAETPDQAQMVSLVKVDVPYEKDNVVSGAIEAWSLSGASNNSAVDRSKESKQGNEPSAVDVPQKVKILALQQALLAGNFEAIRKELPKLNRNTLKNPFSNLVVTLIDLHLGDFLKARARLSEVQKSFDAKRNEMAPKLAAEFQYLLHVTAGAIELSLENREQGLEYFSQARLLLPNREEHGLLLARYFRESGELQLALRVMKEVFGGSQEKSASAFLEMLVLQRELRNTNDELLYLRRASELYPEDLRFDIYLAKNAFLFESQTKGCESFANIYRKYPQDEQSAFNHALCLSLQGEGTASIHVLEKAMAIHTADDRLKLLLASVKAQNQNVLGAGMVLNSVRAAGKSTEGTAYYASILLGALADDPEFRKAE